MCRESAHPGRQHRGLLTCRTAGFGPRECGPTSSIGPACLRCPAALRRAGPPPEFAGLAPLGCPKGSDVTWRLLESCAGPGYFVAGDAASVSDPSASHGVLRALLSGMLAGHLVLRKTFANVPEPVLATEYRTFVRSSFEFDWARGS